MLLSLHLFRTINCWFSFSFFIFYPSIEIFLLQKKGKAHIFCSICGKLCFVSSKFPHGIEVASHSIRMLLCSVGGGEPRFANNMLYCSVPYLDKTP